MKYKYYTFASLPTNDKRVIALAYRAYILSSKVEWERKKIEFKPKIEASEIDFGLPENAIKQFQKLCEQKGLHLSNVEATKEAHNLINLFMVLGKKNNTLLL